MRWEQQWPRPCAHPSPVKRTGGPVAGRAQPVMKKQLVLYSGADLSTSLWDPEAGRWANPSPGTAPAHPVWRKHCPGTKPRINTVSSTSLTPHLFLRENSRQPSIISGALDVKFPGNRLGGRKQCFLGGIPSTTSCKTSAEKNLKKPVAVLRA